jgi:2-dehydro-3-deoxyphosphogluconate aldolase/(4S)-4-hydroxy-2-oxoglutarate aldolase
MTDPYELISSVRLLPVVVLDDAAHAEPLGAALKAGGLPVAEVTFRTAAAQESLRRMAADPELFVGAGTVVRAEQVDLAVAAGARFIVSPGLSTTVVRRAQELGVPVFPGVATPTEIMTALDLGLSTVKLFPAESLGGVSTVKALAAPFPQVRFIPTGGIKAEQLASYLAVPSVVAVGGSWMVAGSLVVAGQFDQITALTAQAVTAAAGVSA